MLVHSDLAVGLRRISDHTALVSTFLLTTPHTNALSSDVHLGFPILR